MSVDDQGGGLGLIGMRERVEALGGVFRKGMEGTGFLIDISIPLPGQAGTHG